MSQLAKNNQGNKVTFGMQITSPGWQKMINNTLGDPKRAQRFTTAIVSAVSNNPQLQECDSKTIISGALLGESLNLSPSPAIGQYYLVPFNNKSKGIKEAVFVISYKGLIQLAIRSGIYTKLNAGALKEGELVSWNPITEEIEVNPNLDARQREEMETTHYYATFTTVSGFTKTIVWSKAKMEAHALRYSAGYANDVKKGYTSTFWSKDFDAMATKTMLRQLLSKWGQLSADMAQGIQSDESVIVAHEGGVFESDPDELPAAASKEEKTVPVETVEDPEEVDLSQFE